MHYKKTHKDFTLNGKSFASLDDLVNFSKTLSVSIYSFLLDWSNDDNFIRVKTSGSTGEPKDIKLRKVHMINSALATGSYFDLSAKTTALLCLSTDFIAGKMMLVRALTLGWDIDVVEPDSHPLKKNKKSYDFSAMVPMQVYNSFDKLSQIKKLIVGGGVVSRELEAKLQSIPTEVYATYGMTETITQIAVKKLNHFDNVISNESEKYYFHTLPDILISKDKRDCLVIHAPTVSDELVVTNDLVDIVSEKEFKWLGRYDNIINSGGIKLIPEQLEEKLSAIIAGRYFVAGLPNEVLGEKLVLIVEGDEDSNVILSKVKHLSSLSKYEIPKEVYFTPKFIETETKKIQRQQTLDLLFSKI